MKNLLLVLGLSAGLFSCSLLQRHTGEEEAEVRDLEPEDGPLFDANGQEISAESGGNAGRVDSEVAKLNTKIAALETKVDVLSASLERVQAHRSQPVIEAEPAAAMGRPQANLAAPMEELSAEIQEPAQISAAPARATPPAVTVRSMDKPSPAASGAEKEFRAAMQLFQNGQHLEAASRFALMAKKFPNHLLAGHALYWAGESASRGQQLALAGDNWAELEKKYPRSAYLPEALAGLAKAHDAQGDSAKAAHYRALLLKSFPKSPVAMKMETESAPAPVAKAARVTHAPPAEDEQAPLFEGDEEAAPQDSESQ